MFIGQILDGPDVARNLPDKKKREIFEAMLKSEKLKLTDKDIELESEEERVNIMPNPVIGEKNPKERGLQPAVYKGELSFPKKIVRKFEDDKGVLNG